MSRLHGRCLKEKRKRELMQRKFAGSNGYMKGTLLSPHPHPHATYFLRSNSPFPLEHLLWGLIVEMICVVIVMINEACSWGNTLFSLVQLLLGFESGMAVVWCLRGKTVEHRCHCSKVWHPLVLNIIPSFTVLTEIKTV